MFCGWENLKVINLEWKDWELVTLAWVKGKLEICHFRTRSARARFPQAPQLWRVVFGSILYCKDTFSIPVFNMAGFRSTLLGFNVVKNGILRFTWHFHKGTSFLIIVIFIFLKRKHLIIVLLLLVGDLFNPSRRFPLKTVEEWFTLFVRFVLDGSETTGSVKNCSSISIVHISCFRIL